MATDVHVIGIKSMYMGAVGTAFASLKDAIKNPSADALNVNPTAVAFKEKFRENEAYPAILLKDSKTGNIDTLTWSVLDWDDATMKKYLGGANALNEEVPVDDHWEAPIESFSGECALRIDWLTGWSWYIPYFKYAGGPGGSGGAADKMEIQVVGKIVQPETGSSFERLATPNN